MLREGLRQGISNGEFFLLENSASKEDASIAHECTNESTSKATSSTIIGDGAKKRKQNTKNNQALAVCCLLVLDLVCIIPFVFLL